MAKPRILIVRDGAIGDLLMITAGLRYLTEIKGYRVDVACKKSIGNAVLANNPYYDHAIRLESQTTMEDRAKRIEELASRKQYAKVADLCGVVENRFLHISRSPLYNSPREFRRAIADYNYYDETMRWMSVPPDVDPTPELYVSASEERQWLSLRSQELGCKWIMIAIAGSSINKAYPFWPAVIKLLQRDPSVRIILSGGPEDVFSEKYIITHQDVDRSRIIATCVHPGFSLRVLLVGTKFVDLVVGPETGLLNASACWDTPKVVLLSHSNHKNLSLHWRNAWPIQAPVECSPCYRLVAPGDPVKHFNTGTWLDEAPKCMVSISPEQIANKCKEALNAYSQRTQEAA